MNILKCKMLSMQTIIVIGSKGKGIYYYNKNLYE